MSCVSSNVPRLSRRHVYKKKVHKKRNKLNLLVLISFEVIEKNITMIRLQTTKLKIHPRDMCRHETVRILPGQLIWPNDNGSKVQFHDIAFRV